MPFSADMNRLVDNLIPIDPAKNSLNENFQIIAKRTAWQNFIGRLIHILTLGLREKNPQLDKAVCKAVQCADEIFKKSISPEDQQRLICAFSKLLKLVIINEGSEGSKIRKLLHRIDFQMKKFAAPPIQQYTFQPALPAAVWSPLALPLYPFQVAEPAPAFVQIAQPVYPAAPVAVYGAIELGFVNEMLASSGQAGVEDVLRRTNESSFFKILIWLGRSAHPNRDNVILMLMATPLGQERTRDLMYSNFRPLLARHFERLHARNRALLNTAEVFFIIETLGDLNNPALQPVLESYASFLSNAQDLDIYVQNVHHRAIMPLFNTGNSDFQVRVLREILNSQDPLGWPIAYRDLVRMSLRTTPQVWAKVATNWPMNATFPPEYWFNRGQELFNSHVVPEAIIASINAFVLKSQNPARNVNIGLLSSYLAKTSRSANNPRLLLELSPAAVEFIQIDWSDLHWLLSTFFANPDWKTDERWMQSLVKGLAVKKTAGSLKDYTSIMDILYQYARSGRTDLATEGEIWAYFFHMSQNPELAREARIHANEYAVKLQLRSIGGHSCPLHKQLQRTDFSDLTILIDCEKIPVHGALVALDPFFKDFAIHKSMMQIPPCHWDEARRHLKCLYGHLNRQEFNLADIRNILSTFRKQKLSLAPLHNPSTGPGVVTLVIENQEIKAHRFILAAAFPFFEALFRSGMKEAEGDRVSLAMLSFDQVQAVVEYAYTDQLPDFADSISREAFEDALDYFTPARKPLTETLSEKMKIQAQNQLALFIDRCFNALVKAQKRDIGSAQQLAQTFSPFISEMRGFARKLNKHTDPAYTSCCFKYAVEFLQFAGEKVQERESKKFRNVIALSLNTLEENYPNLMPPDEQALLQKMRDSLRTDRNHG